MHIYTYIHSNPVITTCVYATPRLLRQIFLTVNHTLCYPARATLVYNNTKYSVSLMTLSQSSTLYIA